MKGGPAGLQSGNQRPLSPTSGLVVTAAPTAGGQALPHATSHPAIRPFHPSALCISKGEHLLLVVFLIRNAFTATQKARDLSADTREPTDRWQPETETKAAVQLTETYTAFLGTPGPWRQG